ncbi:MULTISPECIES: hypothetical protein [unclassified Microcystis]|uniref:hypothetical protein n=1 Tax=unclassified Microcystis TaxID=2643300 RepID=UPI0025828245|nr:MULTISPECIES: hypothetical protein [unclassified Microcystis]MCU7243337.1 hypothetical protein [Microcystis aeruginosa WS75]
MYESQVRQPVEKDNHRKIVAIDIETGAFELAKDSLTASEQLLARFPDDQSSSRLTDEITDN